MAKPSKALVDYIKKHREKGVHIKKIKRKLADAGHPIENIEASVAHVFANHPHLKQSASIGFYLLSGLAVLVVLFIIIFGVTQLTDYLDYQDNLNEFSENQTFEAMSDIDLLIYASEELDLKACNFINNHNIYYACTERYWERDDCMFEYFFDKYDSCWLDKAYNSFNLSLCAPIMDSNLESECIQNLFEDIALAKNVQLCLGSAFTDDCLDYYRSVNELSLTYDFCSLYVSEESRDFCYFGFFSESKQEDICNSMELPQYKRHCLKFSTSTPDELLSLCDDPENSYLFLGNSKEDVNISSYSDSDKGLCFFELASYLITEKGYSCEDINSFINSKSNEFSGSFSNIYKLTKQGIFDKGKPKYLNNPNTMKFFECDFS
ncbi:hypothetical protein HON01_06695 [Candidatus Woesearchaeota archaeon]|jgi:hypothetical protein|nr:hypothetical protein [Candidatus Woesearchaeota archaeon]MBT7367870.1 hypothetical protein [Candidatus Woesearchaeota archaeon]